MAHHGIETSSENIRRVLDGYLSAVDEAMRNPRARVLAGVREVLDAVSTHAEAVQGLLTGNLERGAKIKLGHFDLWRYFAFGAFADDSELRDELGPHAIRRAAEHHRTPFTPERVIVIGDTPHDIACGRAVGARTIAVATGRFSVEALSAFKPDVAIPDLTDSRAFLRLCGLE